MIRRAEALLGLSAGESHRAEGRQLLQDVQGDEATSLTVAERLFVRGTALLVTSSAEAECVLTQAVKLGPNCAAAWNALGECLAEQQDCEQARVCIERSMALAESAAAARNLSVVLRQLPEATATTREHLVATSVDLARKAVSLNVADGHSWLVLGNALMSKFFCPSLKEPNDLQQAIRAYAQASNNVQTRDDSSLRYNRAVLYQYEENFAAAIADLEVAIQSDPSWSQPQQLLASIRARLKLIYQLIKDIEGEGNANGVHDKWECEIPLEVIVTAVVPPSSESAAQSFVCEHTGTHPRGVLVSVYNVAQGTRVATKGARLTIGVVTRVHSIETSAGSPVWCARVEQPSALRVNGVPVDKHSVLAGPTVTGDYARSRE